jgi:heme A synthase
MALATALTTYLLIVWGGIVRVTGSGLGCDSPNGGKDSWPLCAGNLWPPANQAGYIEFFHRWLATLAMVLMIGLAVWVFRKHRSSRRLVVAAAMTLGFFVLQIVLGAITVLNNLPPEVIVVHLANAEFLLGSLIFIAITAYTQGTGRELVWKDAPRRSRLAMGAALLTYAVLLSGSNVVGQGAGAACNGWPLCGNGGWGFSLAQTGLAAVNLFHRFGVGILMLVLGSAIPIVRRAHRGDRAMYWAGVAANVLFLLQIVAGALLVVLRLPVPFKGAHLALASALWASVVVVALLARRRAVEQDVTGISLVQRVRKAIVVTP